MTKIGRPEKQGINYFSLDVDFDSSLEIILSKYGEKGLGIVVRVWQHIYKTKGYYMPYNEDELYMIKRICNDSSVEEIESIIKIMIGKNLFSKKLFEEKAILTSKRLQQNYNIASRNRKSNVINSEYILVSSVIKSEETTQIKEDNIILNKKKLNTTKKEIKKTEVVIPIPYKAIVEVLNKKMDSRFSFNTTDTRNKIKARWNERLKDKKSPDVIFKEFILCINNAYEYWKKKNDFNFMRPKTLFNGDMENRVNGTSYGWEERSIGKNLLPKDIESDWLDDYIKGIKDGTNVNMGDKEKYCKAHKIHYNDIPSNDVILKWLRSG